MILFIVNLNTNKEGFFIVEKNRINKRNKDDYIECGNMPCSTPYNWNSPFYYRIPHSKRFNYLDTLWRNPSKWSSYDYKFNTFVY
tara:strand:- start:47040 stop:47294 length:255 start_codon:yes stop_codon:yes gene_type:complete